ncbi:hypothetical protein WDM22_21495 [Bradyrhizobium septentrionale]|uniref:hypothetical protein n=1 Tax=Bradyrhizobium septentrionale TaxID=1404411 RepID=UPI0030D1E54F
MFPKTGKKFPGDEGVAFSTYAALIANILKSELGNSHQAHKTLMRWTGANERTAKNWLSGSNGPSGEHLLQLMRNSDRIFEFVLKLSHRPVVLSNQRLAEICNSLRVTADLLSEVIELKDVYVQKGVRPTDSAVGHCKTGHTFGTAGRPR